MDRSDETLITDFGLLLETHAALTHAFDERLQRECGLSLRWFEVLIRLFRTPGCCLPAGELGQAISLTSGATTRRIDRMAEAGLIQRRSSTQDGRVVEVCLTAAGEQRLAAALPIHLADLRSQIGTVLNDRQRSDLSAMLRKLRDQQLND